MNRIDSVLSELRELNTVLGNLDEVRSVTTERPLKQRSSRIAWRTEEPEQGPNLGPLHTRWRNEEGMRESESDMAQLRAIYHREMSNFFEVLARASQDYDMQFKREEQERRHLNGMVHMFFDRQSELWERTCDRFDRIAASVQGGEQLNAILENLTESSSTMGMHEDNEPEYEELPRLPGKSNLEYRACKRSYKHTQKNRVPNNVGSRLDDRATSPAPRTKADVSNLYGPSLSDRLTRAGLLDNNRDPAPHCSHLTTVEEVNDDLDNGNYDEVYANILCTQDPYTRTNYKSISQPSSFRHSYYYSAVGGGHYGGGDDDDDDVREPNSYRGNEYDGRGPHRDPLRSPPQCNPLSPDDPGSDDEPGGNGHRGGGGSLRGPPRGPPSDRGGNDRRRPPEQRTTGGGQGPPSDDPSDPNSNGGGGPRFPFNNVPSRRPMRGRPLRGRGSFGRGRGAPPG